MEINNQFSLLRSFFRVFDYNLAKMSTSVSSEPYYDFTTFSTDLISNEPSTNAEEVLPSKASLGAVDIVVIICYIVATFCVGIWVGKTSCFL